MKVKHVKLRNFGPFVEEEFSFFGNLIGVLGPVAAGKSSLIEAIYSGITGDFRKYDNLAAFVRDRPGGEKAASGSIIIDLEHEGSTIHISRRITVTRDSNGNYKGSQSAQCYIECKGKREELTGVKPVDDRISLLIGQEVSLIGQYAFIGQRDIASIVHNDGASRTKLLHSLFGLKKFEKIWTILGDEIRKIPKLVATESTTDLESELVNLNNNKSDTLAHSKRIQAILDSIDIKEINADIQAWESHADVSAQLTAIAALITEATNNCILAENELTTIEDSVKASNQQLATNKPLVDEANKFIAAFETFTKVSGQLAELQRHIENLQLQKQNLKLPDPVTETWSNEHQSLLDQATAELSHANKFVNKYSSMTAADIESAVCSFCGSRIPDLVKELETQRAIIQKIKPLVDQFVANKTKILQQKEKYETALATYKAISNQIDNSINQTSTRIDELKQQTAYFVYDDKSESLYKAHKEFLCKHNNDVATSRQLNISLTASIKRVEAARLVLDTRKAEQQTIQSTINAVAERLKSLNADVMTRHRLQLITYQNSKLEHARATERLKFIDISISATTAKLQRAKLIEEQINRCQFASSLLTDAKDIFKRDALPMLMANKCLSAINIQLQKFLEMLQSSFTAEITTSNDVYKLMCTFNDTSVREASSLSGGESVRFSLSFLLAINEVLASKLGIMALDEPTAALDDESIQNLVSVFSHVQNYAKNTGLQVFLITHSTQLRGIFDQVIDLNSGKVLQE